MNMSILFYVNKKKKSVIIYGIYLNDVQITLWNLGGKQHNWNRTIVSKNIHFKSTYNI